MADGRPTEASLARSGALDDMSSQEILELIHSEDAVAHAAVGEVLPRMAEAVEVLACALSGGGRWFNVGAGTSGRLGVLDASEIPPTYGLSPRIVQGVIAGGERALRSAVEGAEDDSQAGSLALEERGLTLGDVVLGISASGTTPFVLGAIEAAGKLGARTIAITCDPDSPLAESDGFDADEGRPRPEDDPLGALDLGDGPDGTRAGSSHDPYLTGLQQAAWEGRTNRDGARRGRSRSGS